MGRGTELALVFLLGCGEEDMTGAYIASFTERIDECDKIPGSHSDVGFSVQQLDSGYVLFGFDLPRPLGEIFATGANGRIEDGHVTLGAPGEGERLPDGCFFTWGEHFDGTFENNRLRGTLRIAANLPVNPCAETRASCKSELEVFAMRVSTVAPQPDP